MKRIGNTQENWAHQGSHGINFQFLQSQFRAAQVLRRELNGWTLLSGLLYMINPTVKGPIPIPMLQSCILKKHILKS